MTTVRIPKFVNIKKISEDKLLLENPSGNSLTLTKKHELEILDKLKDEVEIKELKNLNYDFGKSEDFINMLFDEGFLYKDNSEVLGKYYQEYFGKNQINIENKKILIIGAGPISERIIKALSDFNASISCYDWKKIRTSDQIMYEKNCQLEGSRIEYIAENYKHVENPRGSNLDEIVKNNFDLVISTDERLDLSLLKKVNEICLEKKIESLTVRFTDQGICFGPYVIPRQTPCFNCARKRSLSNNFDLNDSKKEKADILWPNEKLSVVESFITDEILSILTQDRLPVTLGFLLHRNMNPPKIHRHKIPKLPRCDICGD